MCCGPGKKQSFYQTLQSFHDTNVTRSVRWTYNPVQTRQELCRTPQKRCLKAGQRFAGFCNGFDAAGRNYFRAEKSSATFVSVQHLFSFDTVFVC